MEGKSTPDMISMSRPSRDNRALKNLKVTSDTGNPTSSKKSQIRPSGTSPRVTPASKKAKTGGESLAGASSASKKSETGSSGRTEKNSSNHSVRGISRPKRAADNGGDVTLDALRPVKKRKISDDSVAPSSPRLSPGEATSLKSEGENENGNYTPAALPVTTGAASLPDSALSNPEGGVVSADYISSGQAAEEEIEGGSARQIGSRVTRTANGLSRAKGKRKEELRALRPRPKPTAPKVKKRTRFHEVTLGEGDGPRIVGRRIKVFWPLEKRFFYGHVKSFNGARKLQHKIVYDDKDEEWLRLQNEVFGIELEPGEVFGGPASASATETSTDAKHNDMDNSIEHTGDAATAVDDGDTDVMAVETTGEGRIKPEGVYRRKRKDERPNEDTTRRSDGTIEREKSGEGDRDSKNWEEGHGEADGEKGKGDDEDKKAGKGDGKDKKRKGDSEPKEKTEGASEPKKRLGGKDSVRKKVEANNKQRGALADRLRRVNAKRSSGNFTVRERRKKGILAVTSRDRRQKAIAEGSSGRRKKVGKEEVCKDSSDKILTGHSNLADQEGKIKSRSRIRDDDRLFPSVKSPSADIWRKVPGSKRSKEPEMQRSSFEVKHSDQTPIEEKIAVEDEKLVSSFAVNVRDRKQTQDLSSTGQGVNATGPFEAVMDAYREALSGTKDEPSSSANRGPEEHFAETVREDERASVKTDSLGVLHDDGDEDVVGDVLDEPSRSTSGASPDPHVTSRSGSAVTTETLQFHEDRPQDGNEAESDLLAGGGELNGEDGQRMSVEVSTTEVVLTPPIPPDTQLRPELKESPDKVYRRVKKYQSEKVYRRLKHSRKKVHNGGGDEPADVPQTVMRSPRYWFLAGDFVPSASHVLSYGARIAALGSFPHSFDRTAFSRLQCWSSAEDCRLQLGTFYGAPSVQSLLRVSWKSLRWLLPPVLVTDNEVEDTSSVEARLSVGKIRKSNLQPLSASNHWFKRRAITRRNVFRSVSSSARQSLDPTSDLKGLSFSTVYFVELGVKCRHLGSILRRSSVLSGVPPLASVLHDSELGLVLRSINLIPPHGQTDDHLLRIEQLVVRSDALRRTSVLSGPGPRISRRRSLATKVLDGGALEFTHSLSSVGRRATSLSKDYDRTGVEVGAFYGRPSFESFLRVTRAETYGMDVRLVSSTQSSSSSGGVVDAVYWRSVVRAVAAMHSASNSGDDDDDASSVSRLGLISSYSREETVGREELVVHESRLESSARDVPFMGPWFIDTPTSNFNYFISPVSTTPRPGKAIPRSLFTRKESPLSKTGSPASAVLPSNAFYSLHKAILDGLDFARPQDLETNGRQVGTHLGPPSVVSMLRVSEDFWIRLLAVQRKVQQQPANDVSTSPTLDEKGAGTLQQPQSSMETVDDDEVSDQEERAQETYDGRSGLEPSAAGEDLGSSQPLSGSFGPMKKGRRTGKGLKRSLSQNVGDSVAKDGAVGDSIAKDGAVGDSIGKDGAVGYSIPKDGAAGVDRLADGDILSGRPYSKRTRVEIENSGAATTRDNGLEPSPPFSDLEGKGFSATSLSTQEKKAKESPPSLKREESPTLKREESPPTLKRDESPPTLKRDESPSTLKRDESPLKRVNVLKLRRCPTNKGVWLVAGNSCGAPEDTGLRVSEATEPRGAPESHDLGAGVDPITPIFETSRKRVLNQYLESPPVVKVNLSRNPTVAATLSSADSQEPEMSGSGVRSTKASLNASSPDIWFDSGMVSVNGGAADGLESSKKRRRKGPSPNAVDDGDGISDHSLRRSADLSWGSCTANLLITKSDRCIRETGAIVELQLRHGNNYMLTVFLRGELQYALKADQPVATGTTNKFTHSMMWRGGKAWSLEFVERKQWQVFKDLHEECFQRNARAASVRHIPIPGVKPIQEFPKFGPRYVRPSLKYIRQFDGEAEVAFSSTRIVYDMDSEDEEWLDQVNGENVSCGSATGARPRAKVDEDTFERVIDKLEKTSFIQHQDNMPAEVAAELCHDMGSQEAVSVIHSYWSEKRQRKGMSLVRHFQPAPWEQYQKQLKEWQEKLDKLQQQSPTATKQQLQSLLKRPPLFAFCLRPRGLETRNNKMQKQRSHRKQGLGSSSSRQWNLPGTPSDFFLDSPSKRQPSVDSTGGPFLGSRKFARQRSQEGSFSDPMAVDLTESFNAIAGEGAFTSQGDAGQAISDGTPVFPRAESGSVQHQYETSTTGGSSKRTKKLGRKAKKMKLIAAAEESRRKRQLRTQQARLNGRFTTEMGQSPGSLSDLSPFQPGTDRPSTSGVSLPSHTVGGGQDDDKVAVALAAEAFAKAKREAATTLRSRAQALHAIADAAMHKAVAAVVAADAIHAAERANEEAADRDKAQSVGNHRQQSGDVPSSAKGDVSGRPWGRGSEGGSGGGASFGSWRRALNSASRNANHILSKGSSSKPGMVNDVDDALLPVASWSQELGAGLGTRLLQTGEVSPQIQRYSPVLVEGMGKSPARGVRGEGLVSLGRTRGESMMAMLTR